LLVRQIDRLAKPLDLDLHIRLLPREIARDGGVVDRLRRLELGLGAFDFRFGFHQAPLVGLLGLIALRIGIEKVRKRHRVALSFVERLLCVLQIALDLPKLESGAMIRPECLLVFVAQIFTLT
jgi:hypothetical protein